MCCVWGLWCVCEDVSSVGMWHVCRCVYEWVCKRVSGVGGASVCVCVRCE